MTLNKILRSLPRTGISMLRSYQRDIPNEILLSSRCFSIRRFGSRWFAVRFGWNSFPSRIANVVSSVIAHSRFARGQSDHSNSRRDRNSFRASCRARYSRKTSGRFSLDAQWRSWISTCFTTGNSRPRNFSRATYRDAFEAHWTTIS